MGIPLKLLMKRYILLVFLTTVALKGELEFSGYFITPADASYCISETEAGGSSEWLKVGQVFSGYLIESFDAKNERLTLRKGDEVIRLKLRESTVENGRSIVTGRIMLGPDEEIEGVRATLFLDEESAFPVREGLTLYVKASRLEDGNLKYVSRFERKREDGSIEKLFAPAAVARPDAAFGFRMRDLSFTFKP